MKIEFTSTLYTQNINFLMQQIDKKTKQFCSLVAYEPKQSDLITRLK